MFYSQFILAKKGPLGTIWIAAHLERKLRKNQVADTDIGDSVDSILFPDVPIALRLSSHLLLGVVRIYSRKVNYLFDDCSEALLKVKQAFRSTAVDLPPEESKAPYHSITLPETFDLDDFELPDNDIFQGNYVDLHISSREQITLQDNVEGVVYSTSQFGLDERFGDGDTSGLDLDEELLMAKVDVTGYSGLSADPQASVNSMTLVTQDEHDEMMHANAETQMEDVAGDADLMDYAEAPTTPGLVEQPNLSNVHETSGCDDHIETEENHLTESVVMNLENASSRLNLHQGDEHIMDWSIPTDKISVDAPCNGYHSNDMWFQKGFTSPTAVVAVEHISSENAIATGMHFEAEVDHDKPLLAGKLIPVSDRLDREEALQNGIVKVDTGDVAHEDRDPNSTISEEVLKGGTEKSYDVTGHTVSSLNSSITELQDASVLEKDEVPNSQFRILKPCNADLDEPGPSQSEAATSVTIDATQLETSWQVEVSLSSVVQGDIRNSINDSEQILKEKHIIQPPSSEDICPSSDKSVDLGNNSIQGGGPVGNINISAGIDCPAPEKMRSASEGFVDEEKNLLMEATPRDVIAIDESDAGSRIAGKKRSYTESTLTEQSLNSVESSRAVRTKKTVEAIPDDDDLLSSILVGRRSSVLKLKPTPPPSEITSLKRHRTAPRTSTSKRKVLMDDTMVLHGDTIRQQLMNTEDIRRLRKKAPCTRPEIAMIQQQFLEDQIFGESIFSGVSIYLASLHNQKYDLSSITVSQDEVNSAILASEQRLTCKNDERAEKSTAENALASSRTTEVVSSVGGGELETVRESDEIRTAEIADFNDNKRSGDSEPIVDVNITELQLKPTEDLVSAYHGRLEIAHSQNLAESEIDGRSNSIAGAGNLVLPVEIEPSDLVDAFQPALLDNRGAFDALMQMDEPVVFSDEKRGLECVEMDALVMEGISGKVNDDDCGAVNVGDVIALAVIGHGARDGVLQEACQGTDTIEISRDTPVEYNDPGPSVEIKADIDSIRMDNHGQIHDGVPGEEPVITASSPTENFTLQEGEHIMLHESNLENIVDADFSGINMHDHDDIYYTSAANDTDFLNVDDDEIAEVTDDYIPDAEETRLTENSGWSSRTRAVAQYLQTLFVKEAECGRKTALPMDNILVGKTRKEASRMFFEALVLKTRDYIHVEQPCPFDNITLKPKPKIVKSDF